MAEGELEVREARLRRTAVLRLGIPIYGLARKLINRMLDDFFASGVQVHHSLRLSCARAARGRECMVSFIFSCYGSFV